MQRTFVFAAADAVTAFEGYHITLRINDVWDATDSFVRARPDLFLDHPDMSRASRTTSRPVDVEDAMAVPGRRRRTR
jgi:hypothetical protein